MTATLYALETRDRLPTARTTRGRDHRRRAGRLLQDRTDQRRPRAAAKPRSRHQPDRAAAAGKIEKAWDVDVQRRRPDRGVTAARHRGHRRVRQPRPSSFSAPGATTLRGCAWCRASVACVAFLFVHVTLFTNKRLRQRPQRVLRHVRKASSHSSSACATSCSWRPTRCRPRRPGWPPAARDQRHRLGNLGQRQHRDRPALDVRVPRAQVRSPAAPSPAAWS